MKHIIPSGNWTTALADAIESAQDGDVIVVHNAAMLELAMRAQERMIHARDTRLAFEIQPLPDPFMRE